MKTTLSRWATDNWIVVKNASSLVSTAAVTSALGFIYWWLAARQFSPSAVGLASAAVSAMMLLGSVSALGLGSLLINELPRHPDTAPALIITAVLVAGAAGGVLGLLFALIAPRLSANLQPLTASFGGELLFAVGVGATAVTTTLDQAMIGLLRGELQLWRNGLFAAAKLAILAVVSVWLSRDLGIVIYATWVCGSLLSIGALAALALRGESHAKAQRRQERRGASDKNHARFICHAEPQRSISLASRMRGLSFRLRPEWAPMRKLGKVALGHQALNLALQSPRLMLPVLVTVLLSASANAHFYVAWMIAGFVFLAPQSLTTVLPAVGAAEPRVLARKIRHTLGISAGIGLLACLGLLAAADLALALFGRGYAEQAAWSLRILGLAVFPLIVRYHYVAIARIRGTFRNAAMFMALGGLFELAMATLGASLSGLVGLSVGWTVALAVEAALLARLVYSVANGAFSDE
jgi:O-antigen/teichoic acid export membrane protein